MEKYVSPEMEIVEIEAEDVAARDVDAFLEKITAHRCAGRVTGLRITSECKRACSKMNSFSYLPFVGGS